MRFHASPMAASVPVENAGGPAGVKSARRAIELIEQFAATDAWLSLSDPHARTGYPAPACTGRRAP